MSGGLFANALLRETGREVTDQQAGELRRLHAEAYAERSTEVRPLPGARELLTHLTSTGVPWAIATSGYRESAGPTLELLGLPEDVPVITRDLVERAKPDPDLFLAAADALGMAAENCVVVGDSVWDLLAARRATVPRDRGALRRVRARGARARRRLPRLRRRGRPPPPPRRDRRPLALSGRNARSVRPGPKGTCARGRYRHRDVPSAATQPSGAGPSTDALETPLAGCSRSLGWRVEPGASNLAHRRRRGARRDRPVEAPRRGARRRGAAEPDPASADRHGSVRIARDGRHATRTGRAPWPPRSPRASRGPGSSSR